MFCLYEDHLTVFDFQRICCKMLISCRTNSRQHYCAVIMKSLCCYICVHYS